MPISPITFSLSIAYNLTFDYGCKDFQLRPPGFLMALDMLGLPKRTLPSSRGKSRIGALCHSSSIIPGHRAPSEGPAPTRSMSHVAVCAERKLMETPLSVDPLDCVELLARPDLLDCLCIEISQDEMAIDILAAQRHFAVP